jgi:hypothetical protein
MRRAFAKREEKRRALLESALCGSTIRCAWSPYFLPWRANQLFNYHPQRIGRLTNPRTVEKRGQCDPGKLAAFEGTVCETATRLEYHQSIQE